MENRDIALLISGFAVRIGSMIAAVCVAVYVGRYLTDVFSHVNQALSVLPG